MSDDKLEIVQSPEVKDVELPLPVHYNGIDAPQLDSYVQTDTTVYVKRAGDTMTGQLKILVNDIDNALDLKISLPAGYPASTIIGADLGFNISTLPDGAELIDIGIALDFGS